MLLQVGAVGIGLMVFAFRAPTEGRILLIPYGAGDGATTLRVAIDHGAAVVGEGPFPGSLVVQGRADALSAAASEADILMMAAPPAGCGAWMPVSEAR